MLGKEEIVSPSLDELKEHYHRILTLLGEDPEREGLLKTPERVAKAMLTLTKGYSMDPHEVLRSAKFKEDYNQMVIVKDIDFFSLLNSCAALGRLSIVIGFSRPSAWADTMPVSNNATAKIIFFIIH